MPDSPKLFLICPDCHLEFIIQNNFQGAVYFMTALGSVFDPSDAEYAHSIDQFLQSENIKEIIIVNDCTCRFLQSVLQNYDGFKTNAEETLKVLHSNCQIEILREKQLSRRAYKLAELNIQEQAQRLRESPYIGDKIESNSIKLRGLVYERATNFFSQVDLY